MVYRVYIGIWYTIYDHNTTHTQTYEVRKISDFYTFCIYKMSMLSAPFPQLQWSLKLEVLSFLSIQDVYILGCTSKGMNDLSISMTIYISADFLRGN